MTFSQVTGDGGVNGSFNITYQSDFRLTITYSCSIESPPTFKYTIVGENPNHYAIDPFEPKIHRVGDATKVFFRIISPPKYHFEITNGTQELAYIKDVSVGNWDPSFSSPIPIFGTICGMVLF